MSGDWIKMRVDLHSDPEVVRAARICKVDRDTIVGRLHRTWAWADKVTADGVVDGMTAADLNETLGIKGWAEAMQTIGWLEVTDAGLTFPRFDKHNGKSAKRRASDTALKADKRRNVSPQCPQSVRIASGQIADQRREEKRREEIQKTKGICPDPSEAAGLDRRQAIGWDAAGGWVRIGEAQRKAWAGAYPSVDIDGELAKANAWLLANPTRAGKRNWARFLNTWLGKTHERGSNGAANFGKGTGNTAAETRRQQKADREFPESIRLDPLVFHTNGANNG